MANPQSAGADPWQSTLDAAARHGFGRLTRAVYDIDVCVCMLQVLLSSVRLV